MEASAADTQSGCEWVEGDEPSCSRAVPYNRNLRRGHREPDAIAAALAKRCYVQHTPYLLQGAMQHDNVPASRATHYGSDGRPCCSSAEQVSAAAQTPFTAAACLSN